MVGWLCYLDWKSSVKSSPTVEKRGSGIESGKRRGRRRRGGIGKKQEKETRGGKRRRRRQE